MTSTWQASQMTSNGTKHATVPKSTTPNPVDVIDYRIPADLVVEQLNKPRIYTGRDQAINGKFVRGTRLARLSLVIISLRCI